MDYKHLEISGRQTGKTTRLIEKLKYDFYNDQHMGHHIVILPNINMKQYFFRKLKEEDEHMATIAASDPSMLKLPAKIEVMRAKEPHMIFIGIDNFRVYVDEFDFFKWSNRDVAEFRSMIEQSAKSFYGATTPKYLRTVSKDDPANDSDIIFNLIDLCDGYETKINQDMIHDRYRLNNFPNNINSIEMFGSFINTEELD